VDGPVRVTKFCPGDVKTSICYTVFAELGSRDPPNVTVHCSWKHQQWRETHSRLVCFHEGHISWRRPLVVAASPFSHQVYCPNVSVFRSNPKKTFRSSHLVFTGCFSWECWQLSNDTNEKNDFSLLWARNGMLRKRGVVKIFNWRSKSWESRVFVQPAKILQNFIIFHWKTLKSQKRPSTASVSKFQLNHEKHRRVRKLSMLFFVVWYILSWK